MGAVLHNLEFESGGRAAVAALTLKLLQETGATHEDSDGLINIPLTVPHQLLAALRAHGGSILIDANPPASVVERGLKAQKHAPAGAEFLGQSKVTAAILLDNSRSMGMSDGVAWRVDDYLSTLEVSDVGGMP